MFSEQDIAAFGKGAFHVHDPSRPRYNIAAITPYDWSQPELPDLPLIVHNQGFSSSCVAQTMVENATALKFLRDGTIIDYSAHEIYCQKVLPGGGMIVRDATDLFITQGIETEVDFTSQPETEVHLTDKTGLDLTKAAIDFIDHTKVQYSSVPLDIDSVATALAADKIGHLTVYGDNAGWHTADVLPPVSQNWGHDVASTKPVMRNGKKAIKFLNHWGTWGDNGYGYLYEDYFTSGNVQVVLVPTTNYIIPTPMEFLQHPYTLVEDSQQSGSFGLIKNGEILVATPERVSALVATYLVAGSKGVIALTADQWNNAPKSIF